MGETEVVQEASTRKKIQDLYNWGAALGIFWGLAIAIFDLIMKTSPFKDAYISTITSVTDPVYAQITAMTMNSPLLLWLSNTIMAVMYVLIGYGVKITGTALTGLWSFIVQKITAK